MPCIAPPPPQIEATISVGAAPNFPLTFAPNPSDGSANYIDPQGNLDFSCFKTAISVQFTIGTPGVRFYKGYGKDAISFLDDADHVGTKQPPAPGHHQFHKGIVHSSLQTITFEYHNDWDCGAGDGVARCRRSAYGVYLGNAGGFLHHSDPIINNGGNVD
jgi:hypothetical protein